MWKKITITFIAGLLLIGLLLYSKRYSILVSYLQSSSSAQEMVIREMLVKAKPIIAREIDLNLLEKTYTWATGKRNTNERRSDASDDVRIFVDSAFQNNKLRFMDVHKLSAVDDFLLEGSEIALGWNHHNRDEVLVAFNISLLKRSIDQMEVNNDCSFFKDLKSFVETRVRKN